ncbi:hypothetical protein UM48_004709 [Salmonella enterica subsp. enterica]|nr:hypothetical protein [Salmonella enterica subsp. enterica]
MEYLRVFRREGESTAAAPLYLVEKAKQKISRYKDRDVNELHAQINRSIEARDRWEVLAVEGGEVKAMMIICRDRDSIHSGGDCLFTYLSFSPDGIFSEGYRALKQLAKALDIKTIWIDRDDGKTITQRPYKIK